MTTQVAVVGAGLAGLTLASELVRHKLDVLVLEARDRVGGRTFTRSFDGMSFDLGGQWIGPTQHRMAALCRRFGVETFRTWCQGTKLLDDGVRLRRYEGKIPRLSPLHLAEVALGMMRVESACRTLPRFDDPRATGMDHESVATWRNRVVKSHTTRALFDVAVRTVFGAEPETLSALWFAHYLRTGGGFAAHVDTPGGAQQDRMVGGAQQIAEHLAAALGERVRLASPVREIAQHATGVTLRFDGGEVHAERCVLCVPPPLATRIAFSPSLPGARDLALQRTPMGATVKVLARYERAFWRTRGMSGEYVSTRGPVSMAIDNTGHDGAHPALLCFVVGRDAFGWSSRDRRTRHQDVLGQLARAFGDEARHPIAIIEQDWAEEPYTRGCPVGNMGFGLLSTAGRAWAAPVGRVHWAGTETASEWTGYMEGAVASGERAAREVIAALAGDLR